MEKTELLLVIVKTVCGLAYGLAAGWSAVWVYNHLPLTWFLDEGEELDPDPERAAAGRKTLRVWPWRYVFAMFFTAVGIWLIVHDPLTAAAELTALWLLVILSVSDLKYRILPDGLVILVLATAIGSVHYHGLRDILLGLLAGFGVMAACALLGKALHKKMAVGGGDIKLMAALGALTGLAGILAIFVLSTLAAAFFYAFQLGRKRMKPADALPMAPFITGATAVYMVFLFDRMGVWLSL